MNKPKLLMICPSQGRPELCRRMLESFYATSKDSTGIAVVLTRGDPELSKYGEMLLAFPSVYVACSDVKYLVHKINWVATELLPSLEYYGECNDDHVFITPGWDTKLVSAIEDQGHGWGLACGNDLLQPDWHRYQHPSGAIISGNIVWELECFFPRIFKHLQVDEYCRHMFGSSGIDRLFYCPDVIIEHRHVLARDPDGKAKGAWDQNYRWVYDPKNWKESQATLAEWVINSKPSWVKKIQEKMK